MAQTSRPDLILFDIGQVIVPYDDHKLIENIAARCSDPEASTEIKSYLTTDWKALQTGAMADERLHQKFVIGLGFDGSFKDFQQVWCAHTARDPAMETLVREVEKTTATALLSNATKIHMQHFTSNYELIGRMNSNGNAHFSCLMGAVKPDREAFEITLDSESRRLGRHISPEKTLFIDDISQMTEGAKAVGMDTIVFTGIAALIPALVSRCVPIGVAGVNLPTTAWAGARAGIIGHDSTKPI